MVELANNARYVVLNSELPFSLSPVDLGTLTYFFKINFYLVTLSTEELHTVRSL